MMRPGAIHARRGRGWLVAALVAAVALVGCSGDADSASTTSSPSTVATTTPTPDAGPTGPTTPDEVVPSTASGFSPYTTATGEFSVDLPSGWGVTLSPEGAVATPVADSVEGMIMVVDAEVDGTSVDDVAALLDALPKDGGEVVDVPGAVDARRYQAESFAPFEAVAAVDAEGNAAVVIAFDNGGSTADQREHVLTSLQFPAVG